MDYFAFDAVSTLSATDSEAPRKTPADNDDAESAEGDLRRLLFVERERSELELGEC